MEKKCFVIMPIGMEGGDTRKRSDQLLENVIEPAARECGYKTIRADQIPEPGMINLQIIDHLFNDDLVIADLTESNPNVMYELGMRHAFVKPVIQIKDQSDKLPFDVIAQRTIEVDYRYVDRMKRDKAEIIKQIKGIEENPKEVGSPISFKMNYDSLTFNGNKQGEVMKQLVQQIEELTSRVSNLSSSNGAYRLLEQERRFKHRKKSYYIRRINSYYEQFRKYHNDLKSHISQYLENRSDENTSDEKFKKLKRYIDERYMPQIGVFVREVEEDMKPIIDLIDNPRLADKIVEITALNGSFLEGYAREIGGSLYHDNSEIVDIREEMDSTINSIEQYMHELREEINNEV